METKVTCFSYTVIVGTKRVLKVPSLKFLFITFK